MNAGGNSEIIIPEHMTVRAKGGCPKWVKNGKK